jgi:hypothetical protein
MTTSQRIIRPNTVTLDANGEGTAFVTVPSGVTWNVELVSVSTNTPTSVGVPQSRAAVYFGAEAVAVNFIEETFFGDGDSTDSKYPLLGGDSLCVQWLGGIPGAQATMCVRAMQVQAV